MRQAIDDCGVHRDVQKMIVRPLFRMAAASGTNLPGDGPERQAQASRS